MGDGGVPADGDSFRPSVSFDGRWIAFESGATNLTSVAPGFQQVYLRDMNAPAGSGIVMVSLSGLSLFAYFINSLSLRNYLSFVVKTFDSFLGWR